MKAKRFTSGKKRVKEWAGVDLGLKILNKKTKRKILKEKKRNDKRN